MKADAPANVRVAALLDALPEFADESLHLYSVMERFSDHVSARFAAVGATDETRACLAWVERLAAGQDPGFDNLLDVAFLEAAAWGELGAAAYFGPWTRALARRRHPRLLDPAGP